MERQGIQIEEKRERQEAREAFDLVLKCFPKESRFYWTKALIKRGIIDYSIAGRLLYTLGII